MLIRAYRVQLRDSLERRFIRRDYENKETDMTQPMELDRSCHATTTA